MEFEILAGVVIEHGSLITGLPGWPAITMTYHRAEEHGVCNKILRHDKHRPEETHTTLCSQPQTRPSRTRNGGFSQLSNTGGGASENKESACFLLVMR